MQHRCERLLDGLPLAVDRDVGVQRFLVWIADTGELRDLACEGFRVQALDVAPRQLIDGAAHVHLDEAWDAATNLVTDGSVRRDRCDDCDPP